MEDKSINPDKYVLGIDAAWTDKEPSGAAVLKYNKDKKYEIVRLGRSYEEFLKGNLDWTEEVKGTSPDMTEILRVCGDNGYNIFAIALDIPLSPTPIKGRRAAENLISKKYAKKDASTHSPNEERPGLISQLIFEQLESCEFNFAYKYIEEPVFIEVYPHTAIIELLNLEKRLPYKVHKKNKYWPKASVEERNNNIIGSLNYLRTEISKWVPNVTDYLPELNTFTKYSVKQLKGYEDALDAVICAIVGCFYINGKAEAYGDEKGAIWVPKVDKEAQNVKIYNKLVRDKIPQIIEESGKKCDIQIAAKEEYTKLLEEKLKEEVNEFIEAKNLEELADVMEVLFGLADNLGYSEDELLEKRNIKRIDRGGFKEGIKLLKVYERDN
jgi:predicted house-cleaning noncanonical NTP pyrophosphatase (MazG superfamily)/predicted RNase H-like nuclease